MTFSSSDPKTLLFLFCIAPEHKANDAQNSMISSAWPSLIETEENAL